MRKQLYGLYGLHATKYSKSQLFEKSSTSFRGDTLDFPTKDPENEIDGRAETYATIPKVVLDIYQIDCSNRGLFHLNVRGIRDFNKRKAVFPWL